LLLSLVNDWWSGASSISSHKSILWKNHGNSFRYQHNIGTVQIYTIQPDSVKSLRNAGHTQTARMWTANENWYFDRVYIRLT
jgi:hypothetical protein